MSHQNWDRLNYLNLTPEVRYQNWLMFGPRVSIPLNKPDEFYHDVSRADLFTIGGFVRVELGGVLRAKDCDDRRASVEKVGIVGDEPENVGMDVKTVEPEVLSVEPVSADQTRQVQQAPQG